MITLLRNLIGFDGADGWVVFILAVIGAVRLVFAVWDFLAERFELTCTGPFRLRRRWYHPRAIVQCDGTPLLVATWHQEVPWGTWVLAYPLDDEDGRIPMEWIRLAELTPGPSWRERRRDRTVAA